MTPRNATRAACVVLAAALTGMTAAAHAQSASSGKPVVPDVPAWLHNAVFYQIYPQTFYDTNGDGIGDFQGIIEKLDYVKSLGADGIWLNPFFDSPFHDAGYDVRDYYKVAPRYGTNDDARRLFEEAHKRGLKVIFDYVISYTAIDHPWFVDSCEQQPNRHSNWYVWTDNVWIQEEGPLAGSFIHGYCRRNGNFMRNFYWSQPALNFGFGKPDPKKKWQLSPRDPDVLALREELKKIARFWMDMGADGLRADMAGALVKGEDVNQDTKGFWREIREMFRERYPQGFMVSEWSYPVDALDGAFHADFFHWVDGYNDLMQKESWRILNDYSDGHSFFDREGKGDVARFLASYMPAYQATRSKGYICLPIGNHDLARMNNQRTTDELEMIVAFGLSMPGVPFLYYGNEIGMRQLGDLPYVEGAYKPRSGARTPMQWAPGKNLGFSSAAPEKLYLPVDAAADAPTVAAQENDRTSLLNRVRRLIRLKHTEPALAAYAEFVPLYAKSFTYPLVYARTNGDAVVLAIFNPSAQAASAALASPAAYKTLRLLAGKTIPIVKKAGTLRIDAPGQSYALYRLVK